MFLGLGFDFEDLGGRGGGDNKEEFGNEKEFNTTTLLRTIE